MTRFFQDFLRFRFVFFLITLIGVASLDHACARDFERAETEPLRGSINRPSAPVPPDQIARDTRWREIKALFPFSTMITSVVAAGVEGHNPWGYGATFLAGFAAFVVPRGVFNYMDPENHSERYERAEKCAYLISGTFSAVGIGAILGSGAVGYGTWPWNASLAATLVPGLFSDWSLQNLVDFVCCRARR